MKERCDLSKRTKAIIDDTFRFVLSQDDVNVTDFMFTDPRAMQLLGYCGQALELCYDEIDELHETYEISKRLEKDLESIKLQLKAAEVDRNSIFKNFGEIKEILKDSKKDEKKWSIAALRGL